jgi:hypothetical protein
MLRKSSFDLPLYSTTLSSHMKKNTIRVAVNESTRKLAELLMKKLFHPNRGGISTMRNRNENTVAYNVSFRIEI